jgi:predicted nucleic acid-binding protein
MRFIDSNVFLYAYGNTPVKTEIAQREVALGAYINVQILAEVAHVMRNKMRRSWDEINARIQDMEFIAFDILPLTREMQREAFALSKKYQVSIYDSQIIAAALKAGCNELISEDLQHGQRFGKLSVRNPFID